MYLQVHGGILAACSAGCPSVIISLNAERAHQNGLLPSCASGHSHARTREPTRGNGAPWRTCGAEMGMLFFSASSQAHAPLTKHAAPWTSEDFCSSKKRAIIGFWQFGTMLGKAHVKTARRIAVHPMASLSSSNLEAHSIRRILRVNLHGQEIACGQLILNRNDRDPQQLSAIKYCANSNILQVETNFASLGSRPERLARSSRKSTGRNNWENNGNKKSSWRELFAGRRGQKQRKVAVAVAVATVIFSKIHTYIYTYIHEYTHCNTNPHMLVRRNTHQHVLKLNTGVHTYIHTYIHTCMPHGMHGLSDTHIQVFTCSSGLDSTHMHSHESHGHGHG
jgi:hypothetical protein